MATQPGGHGTQLRDVDLYKGEIPSEGSDGKFGRLFPIGETQTESEPAPNHGDSESPKPLTQLRPHPSPRYDLERLGDKDGPMSGGLMQESRTPAGITFLGQFIDHDITLDVQSKFEKPEINVKLENGRTPNLDLDCVYGGGREASPHLFTGPYLLEGKCIGKHGKAEASDLLRNPTGRAIIGDPRNDENIIVSQVHGAFVRFHNRCVDELKKHEPTLDDDELFEHARDNTLHYYHRVVLEDFLFHVVGVDMIQEIAQNGRQYYFSDGFWDSHKKPRKPFMPVEFSVAAFRFGHSQVRDTYKLNKSAPTPLFNERDTEQAGTLRGFHPVPEGAKLEWKNFFELPLTTNSQCQKAFKIDPFLPAPLLELPIPVVASGITSLASRNLVRGRVFRLPAGDWLAEKMLRDGNLLGGRNAIVRVDEMDEFEDPIRNILHCLSTQFAMKTIPMWLYFLIESSVVGKNGDHLGPAGGRIVAEVIMGLLDHFRDMSGKGLDFEPSKCIQQNINIVPTPDFGPRMSMRAFIDFAFDESLEDHKLVRGVGVVV